MKNKELIIDQAKELGLDYIGFAGVGRFESCKDSADPVAIMPDCKTVISFGIKFLEGEMETIRNSENPAERGAGSFGYIVIPSSMLATLSNRLEEFIINELKAAAISTTLGSDGAQKISSHFSQKSAAIAAGLGQSSFMGRAVTPESGPRVLWGSILTDLEIEEDPLMDDGIRLCNPQSCRICRDNCPAGALEADAAKASCPSGIDAEKCKAYACAPTVVKMRPVYKMCEDCANNELCDSTISVCGAAQLTPQTNMEEIERFEKDHFIQKLRSIPDWRCGKCIALCPIGKK